MGYPQETTLYNDFNVNPVSEETRNRNKDLFTDPSLLVEIKRDLEEIKMRKSMHGSRKINNNQF